MLKEARAAQSLASHVMPSMPLASTMALVLRTEARRGRRNIVPSSGRPFSARVCTSIATVLQSSPGIKIWIQGLRACVPHPYLRSVDGAGETCYVCLP
ncbi:hypothetical protein E2C01_008978 [Portunus trituberculatus]|uniref:Uncharacterized protein n=1 Tax=Portunus trituberculatus TaxID=210409 RepID=A0A5B7D277_PORTR|nr:hypothetical protein [Portunus trituberculatus]